MAKAVKVKWALSNTEPEDNDFLSNEDIVKKNKKKGEVLWPGKGPHTFTVKRLSVKPNRNDDPRVAAMLIMQNPKKSDAAVWNGYLIFDGFNVTEQGKSFLNRFLKALGLTWEDFIERTKAVADGDKQQIVQIGKVKFGEDAAKDPTLRATIKVKPADDFNDDEHMEIGRYMPAEDEDEEEDDDEESESFDEDESDEDEDEDSEEEDEDDEDSDDDDEDEDEDDDDDDDEDEEDEDEEEEEDLEEDLRAELKPMTVPNLRKRAIRSAKKAKVDTDEVPDKKKALIDFIVNVELNEPPF